MIGQHLVAIDELLDEGVVLDFSGGTRAVVPLHGTDAPSVEIAVLHPDEGQMVVLDDDSVP